MGAAGFVSVASGSDVTCCLHRASIRMDQNIFALRAHRVVMLKCLNFMQASAMPLTGCD